MGDETFNEKSLTEKLSKLNSSQQSIESLSRWCITHCKKAKQIVETWESIFKSVKPEQRVSLLYLSNDILQNSRRKGSEFVNEFWKVLPESLKDVYDSGHANCRKVASRLVGVSLAFVIHESANPHIAILGRLPGTTVYRNIQQYPEAYTYNGIVIVRIDAPIYFANISYIKDRLREYEIEDDGSIRRGPEVKRVHFVIIEMAPTTYIDSSAVQALKDLHQEYKSRNIQIAISNPNRDVLVTLTRSGVVDLIGREWYFVRVHDAVQVCLQHVQSLNESSPRTQASLLENKSSIFQRLMKQRGGEGEVSPSQLESGNNNNNSSHLEPLLSKKS